MCVLACAAAMERIAIAWVMPQPMEAWLHRMTRRLERSWPGPSFMLFGVYRSKSAVYKLNVFLFGRVKIKEQK